MFQDEGSFSLGDNGRNALKTLGSRVIATLSWRDTWAFAVVKAGEVLGEDVGKSVNINNWGLPVNLHVTMPLADSGELSLSLRVCRHRLLSAGVDCDWPDSAENRKRREFCMRYEGYGALCHCSNPLPLDTKPPKVRQHV